MKYKIPSILIALFLTATAFGNETFPGLEFTPDNHYDLGKASLRPAVVYVGTEVNIANSAHRHVQVSLSAAQIIAMYTTPVTLVAAQGAGKSIVVHKLQFKIVRTSTAFTGGGAVIVQYGTTANGGGTQALDSTLASTVITGSAGTSTSIRNGAVISDSTATTNAALAMSNATAVFAAGTGTATVDIWYSVL